MNVTEFAEQIVFGKTIEDKLISPGQITQDKAGAKLPTVRSLASPGRPVELRMRHDLSSTGSPPSDEQLENELARGKLLHYLANHELLATELMALVLLKFPDAPYAFRRGVLVTLQEEQQHTRMYIDRMRECGVEFGAYPVGGRFWRIVEPMQTPMDFVSRLSLTFEQANLDYSLHFSKVFARQGDTETAGLLRKIYEDEIGHVQHGLEWFRQWKSPEQSDWEAYQAALEYPMSPQLGRGPRGAFNREGRVRAGLSREFIDAIEVFRQSRGRSPTVRWFDPGAEAGLTGEGESHLLDQLGKDLELVMAPIARQGDVVLVRETPSIQLRKRLIEYGFELPEFVQFESRASLAHRKLGELAPWAWTPANHRIATPLIQSSLRKPPPWSDEQADLFAKSWGASCLGRWLSMNDGTVYGEQQTPDWFSGSDCVAIEIYSQADVGEALEVIRSRGYEEAVFKPELSAAGRGQRRFATGRELDSTDEAWLQSVFNRAEKLPHWTRNDGQQPIAILEPVLDRVLDLSFLWEMRCENSESTESPGPHLQSCIELDVSRSIKRLGWTRSLVTPGGKYVGTRLSKPFFDCAAEVKQFLLTGKSEKLHAISNWLEPRLAAELSSRKFSGCFGVDAFLYRAVDGELKIKPLVELNPRTTMGHVALALQEKVAPGVVAEFRILTRQQWSQLPESNKRVPLTKTKGGRWSSGVILLSEINQKTKLVPAVFIGRDNLPATVALES